jgi:serine/threonine protein kinase
MTAPAELVGQTLGHHRILEQIGAGGMGVVSRAYDEQLERDVAVKVLPVGTLPDDAARRRFRKEALALAKVNHPNNSRIPDLAALEEPIQWVSARDRTLLSVCAVLMNYRARFPTEPPLTC